MRARFGSWMCVLGTACAPAAPPAPSLPELSSLDPAVAQMLVERATAVGERPTDGRARAELALALAANELWSEAEQAFRVAAELEAGEPLWSLHHAICLGSLGRSGEALARLREVARAMPEAAHVAQRLGEAALEEGAFEEARAAFERGIELAPDSAEVHTGLGAAERALGRPGPAAAALERALVLDPGYQRAHYQLGLAYRALGRLPEAERELALGLGARVRFLPDPFTDELRHLAVTGPARARFALALIEEGRIDRAVRVLENLHAKDPSNVAVLNNLGVALQRAGEPERAREILEQALALDPAVAPTWLNLAGLALERNLSVRALECVARAREIAPQSAKAALMLGRVRLHQGREEEALAAFEEARALDPRESEALAQAGRLHLGRGEIEAARACFASLASDRPDDLRAHLGLAECAARLGLPEETGRAFRAARALAPEHPDVLALRARLGPAVE